MPKKKKTTPIINATKKMNKKDAVAMGKVIGKNALSDKVIARENKKKRRNIEEIFIKKSFLFIINAMLRMFLLVAMVC